MFPALAQPAGTVAELNFHSPRPGMTQKYEAARKNHMAWHKSQKDPWSWYTYEVVSGEHSGSYITGTFGHAWKDYDERAKFLQDDSVDFLASVAPTLASSFTRYQESACGPEPLAPCDLSRAHGFGDCLPAQARVGERLRGGVKKINEGIKKTSYPQQGASRWFQLTSGGEGPLFVLVGDRANWAAFQPPDKTLDAMMEEAYGKEQGAAMLANARKAIRTVTPRRSGTGPN